MKNNIRNLTVKIEEPMSNMDGELFEYIKNRVKDFDDGKIPTMVIKDELELMYHYNLENNSSTSWVFAACAIRLEDAGLINYHSGINSYLSLPELNNTVFH